MTFQLQFIFEVSPHLRSQRLCENYFLLRPISHASHLKFYCRVILKSERVQEGQAHNAKLKSRFHTVRSQKIKELDLCRDG